MLTVGPLYLRVPERPQNVICKERTSIRGRGESCITVIPMNCGQQSHTISNFQYSEEVETIETLNERDKTYNALILSFVTFSQRLCCGPGGLHALYAWLCLIIYEY